MSGAPLPTITGRVIVGGRWTGAPPVNKRGAGFTAGCGSKCAAAISSARRRTTSRATGVPLRNVSSWTAVIATARFLHLT
jgi:hypothetical protein